MKKKIDIIRFSVYLLVFLMISSWVYIFVVDGADLLSLFSSKNAFYFNKFIRGLLGIGEKIPAFLDKELWKNAIVLSFETFVMSIINLSSCGASKGQLFLYGIIPTVMSKFITYILYRWEVIIRSSIVVGIIKMYQFKHPLCELTHHIVVEFHSNTLKSMFFYWHGNCN